MCVVCVVALTVLCVAPLRPSLAAAAPVDPPPQWTPLPPPTGEVGDAKCNVEEVEAANERQLHGLLSELTNTTYFRLFQVDLNRKCKFWNRDMVRESPPPPRGARSSLSPRVFSTSTNATAKYT